MIQSVLGVAQASIFVKEQIMVINHLFIFFLFDTRGH